MRVFLKKIFTSPRQEFPWSEYPSTLIYLWPDLAYVHFSRQDEASSVEARTLRIQTNELIDSKYGFDRYKDPTDRLGWLINMHPVSRERLSR